MISSLEIGFGLVAIAFSVWIYRAWRALRTLLLAPAIRVTGERTEGKVSVIIPAKNEEKNIAACVDRFLNQSHPNLEIIVANDSSTDKTEEILKSYGDQIRYVLVPPTPEGWTGKNFAVHNAVRHSSGDWFLFTDADTRHEPESIASSLYYAQTNNVRFLTLLPKCLAGSFWELLLQPLTMSYLGLWFPLEAINHPDKPVYFANGQYILMDRELYKRIKGHEAVRGEFLEDFAMMKTTKMMGYRAQCALGPEIFGTRMYDSLTAIWQGWRRIYLHAFRRKAIMLFSRFLSVLLFSVLPFIALFLFLPSALQHPSANGFVLGALAAVILLILATSWKTYGIVKADRLYALLHPMAAFLIALILLDAWWMAISGKRTVWR